MTQEAIDEILANAKAKVKAMSDETLMETVYMGEQERIGQVLYSEACEELLERNLQGDPYVNFIKWYQDEFES